MEGGKKEERKGDRDGGRKEGKKEGRKERKKEKRKEGRRKEGKKGRREGERKEGNLRSLHHLTLSTAMRLWKEMHLDVLKVRGFTRTVNSECQRLRPGFCNVFLVPVGKIVKRGDGLS